jgi:hypothetical protein
MLTHVPPFWRSQHIDDETTLIILERGADVHMKSQDNKDALYSTIRDENKCIIFVLLCCECVSADVKNVLINKMSPKPKWMLPSPSTSTPKASSSNTTISWSILFQHVFKCTLAWLCARQSSLPRASGANTGVPRPQHECRSSRQHHHRRLHTYSCANPTSTTQRQALA